MATLPDEPPGTLPLRHLREVIFPFFGGRAVWPKQHLLPIFVPVFAGLALVSVYNNGAAVNDTDVLRLASRVNLIIAVYIAFLINCYIYEMCGRATNRLLIAVVAYWTFAAHYSSLLWHNRWYIVVKYDGEMSDCRAARWLRKVAPRARTAARSNNLPALTMAVKSGAALASGSHW